MFDGTGKQIETDGPLYVWDGCQACEGGGGFDLSSSSASMIVAGRAHACSSVLDRPQRGQR